MMLKINLYVLVIVIDIFSKEFSCKKKKNIANDDLEEHAN